MSSPSPRCIGTMFGPRLLLSQVGKKYFTLDIVLSTHCWDNYPFTFRLLSNHCSTFEHKVSDFQMSCNDLTNHYSSSDCIHGLMTSSNGYIFRATGPLCGDSPVTGEFPSQRPVTRSFGVLYELIKRLIKQSRRRWFETLSLSLWRHCNGSFLFYHENIVYKHGKVLGGGGGGGGGGLRLVLLVGLDRSRCFGS